MTTHVLILCTHNSARSVLAEGMLNHWAERLGKDVRAYSAGSAPGGVVNPHALAVLSRSGIDTRGFRSTVGTIGSMGMEYHIIHHLHPRIPLMRTPAAYRDLRPILEARGCTLDGL